MRCGFILNPSQVDLALIAFAKTTKFVAKKRQHANLKCNVVDRSQVRMYLLTRMFDKDM